MIRHEMPGRLELKLVARTVARTPLLTATAVFSLAIGITLAATAYGIVAGLVFATLDVPEGNRIVQLRDLDVEHGWDVPLDPARYERRRAAFTTVSPFAAYSTTNMLVESPGATGKVVSVATLSLNGFDALRVRPQVGRLFTGSDSVAEAATAVVLRATLARELFGSEQAALGGATHVGNQPRTVVAVMPDGFRFPFVSDAWIPLGTHPTGHPLTAFGRLAPGATMDAAAAEFSLIGARESAGELQGPHLAYRVLRFAEIAPNPTVAVGLWLAVLALILLLLVSAANVGNLLLARTAARGFEFAVRAAMGASRRQLVAQVGLEALVMTTLGAVAGGAGAAWALEWFQSAVTDLPYWVDLSLRWDIVAFIAAATVLATIVVSLLPARQLSTVPLTQAIREHASGFGFGRFSSVLIAVEMTIAVAFLGAIGSVGRGLAAFGFKDTAIAADRTLIGQIYFGQPPALSTPDAPTGPAARRAIVDAFYAEADRDARRLVERLASTSQVASAALGSHFPGNELDERSIEIEGDSVVHRTRAIEIGGGYFEVLGRKLLTGRDFHESERTGAGSAVIVNARFAERYGLVNALGRRIRFVDATAAEETRYGPWLQIVGVAPDLGLNPGNPVADDGVYTPLEPTNILRIVARSTGPPQQLTALLHREALALSTRPTIQWSKPLASQMAEPVILFRSLGIGLLVLGGIALLLSGASVYALLSLRVTRQRRDIAVRMALGAPRRAVVRSVLGSTLRHMVAGSAAGLAIGLLITRAIATIPWEVGISDRGSLGMTVALLGIIGLAACAIPLGRALRLHPATLLREG